MTITIEEAQVKLGELIDQLAPGQELVITRDSRPVAHLVGVAGPIQNPQPIAGRGRGKFFIVSEDDEHLADFAEYLD